MKTVEWFRQGPQKRDVQGSEINLSKNILKWYSQHRVCMHMCMHMHSNFAEVQHSYRKTGDDKRRTVI